MENDEASSTLQMTNRHNSDCFSFGHLSLFRHLRLGAEEDSDAKLDYDFGQGMNKSR